MGKKLQAVIIGAGGFGGQGLIQILTRHPEMTIKQLIDIKDAGKPVSAIFPHLKGICDMTINEPGDLDYNGIDIAFFSTPDRAGMSMIHSFSGRGIPVIDFSGDFRFTTPEEYRIYARNRGVDEKHLAPDVIGTAVYGLPEINAEKIRKAKIVGNPGCFAISMILALLPAVEGNIIDAQTIICDGKTGVSGAGKNPGEANFYPQRYENVNTYREGRHQHLVEVENVLGARSRGNVRVLFVPQIVPLNRGILMTAYAEVKLGIDTKKLFALYSDYYSGKPFVTVTDSSPNTADVRGSNYCRIRPMVDERTGKLLVVSVIDNLMKGQSGNAVQNGNIMLGIEETAGLDIIPFYP